MRYSSEMDVAIDLGTARTQIHGAGRGVMVDEPSVVAVRAGGRGRLVAAGRAAHELVGREPGHVNVVHPLRGGVVSDSDACVLMLRAFLDGIRVSRVLISAPRGVTAVEREAFREVAERSTGARQVRLIDEPLAAALGADLAVEAPRGLMLVDVGGGISEAVVIALGEIVCSESLRVGGHTVNEHITAHLRARRGLEIGDLTAERLKLTLATEGATADRALAKGRFTASGLPGTVEITAGEVVEALAATVDEIAERVVRVFEQLSPELVGDVADHGVVLSGGGSLTQTLAGRIARRTGCAVRRAPDPHGAVIRGNGRALAAV